MKKNAELVNRQKNFKNAELVNRHQGRWEGRERRKSSREPTLEMATIWLKPPNLYQRSAKHHDHYKRALSQENANGLNEISLRANLLCNENIT